ncbi:M20/M25/M40 family metallo-hydrolase [Pseudaminobacter salicylatoxidans]|uniref:M20/M25/M40 family metallo-hydrolase n=1 Tax=Pseudaminobacter salicylatoxidans TaxID=93369 RepID=UPI0002ECF919|nr:M20/M25/M40 family metallo-hydrolase [Pseudaminobacter salicylatoxidans]
MTTTRDRLLTWLDAERENIVTLLMDLLRARSPNPPGDTRDAAKVITDYLDRHGLFHRIISPHPEMPNVVAAFDAANPGRHLVLNGHIDVFPVPEDHHGWSSDPWQPEARAGKIYGRGACDMKPGTIASVVTYVALSKLQEALFGKLTLTCVSDEETFGPWGARYLVEHHPEVLGDCMLNGEPSGPESIRFGERGPLWLEFEVRTAGAHGAMSTPPKAPPRSPWPLLVIWRY